MRRPILIGFLSGVGLLGALALLGPGAISASGMEPTTCAACHVMEKNVESFRAKAPATSHEALSCSDCHVPHGLEGLIEKYKTGIRHVMVNASGEVPEVIRLRPQDREVVVNNCVRCHTGEEHFENTGTNSCLNCHANIPHGERGVDR